MASREVNAKALKKALTRYIQARKDRINDTTEKLIQIEMATQKGFFKHYYPTRQEAIDNLHDALVDINMTGGHWQQRAEELLRLCNLPGSKRVSLDESEAKVYYDYFDLDDED